MAKNSLRKHLDTVHKSMNISSTGDVGGQRNTATMNQTTSNTTTTTNNNNNNNNNNNIYNNRSNSHMYRSNIERSPYSTLKPGYSQQRTSPAVTSSMNPTPSSNPNSSRPVIGTSRILSTHPNNFPVQAPRSIISAQGDSRPISATLPIQITPRPLPKFAPPGVRPPLFPRGTLHLSSISSRASAQASASPLPPPLLTPSSMLDKSSNEPPTAIPLPPPPALPSPPSLVDNPKSPSNL